MEWKSIGSSTLDSISSSFLSIIEDSPDKPGFIDDIFFIESGEKDYEEFYTSNEKVDFNSFSEIGIINQQQIDSNPAIDYKEFKSEVSKIFKNQFKKEGIVSLFESIVPEFKHLEKDKSLEQKM